jgi:PAS domain S-box-containing protein
MPLVSPDHLQRIVERIPSMLAYWDRELICRYANPAYREWFGVDPDSLIGHTLRELLGPKLFALNEPYARAALSGVEQRFERDVIGPAGVRRSLARYLPDVQGSEVRGFIAYVTDVTPLKIAQDRLKAARLRTAASARALRRRTNALREAQRVAQVGSWEWRIDSGKITWSAELCRLFGLDPLHPPPSYEDQASIYLPDSWQALQQAVSQSVEDGTPYELELEIRRPDGSTGWIEARGEAIRDGEGRIIGLRGTALDISWRRQLEEARVRVQVSESANRSKTELLSRVSHELRTPLNAILGFGQLLQAGASLPQQQRQWLDLIVDNGRNMLALTEDLLDVAAAESGRLAVTEEVIDLVAVVENACSVLAGEAQHAGVTIELKPTPLELRLVIGDSLRTRQVVVNLLSNAIKYGRPGTAVRLSVEAGADHLRCLHVDDAGAGLSEEQISHLFTPFDRLGAERTRVRGVGLGLALSQQLAQRMGGRIEVHSRPGVGSRFTLLLRAANGRNGQGHGGGP